jgi:hypothetical protein
MRCRRGGICEDSSGDGNLRHRRGLRPDAIAQKNPGPPNAQQGFSQNRNERAALLELRGYTHGQRSRFRVWRRPADPPD